MDHRDIAVLKQRWPARTGQAKATLVISAETLAEALLDEQWNIDQDCVGALLTSLLQRARKFGTVDDEAASEWQALADAVAAEHEEEEDDYD